DDDFNTPEALALIHDWRSRGLGGDVRKALEIFGLGSLAEFDVAPPHVVELAEQRQRARADQNWSESDRLRGEIAKLGWVVRDTSDGFQLLHP
ncbi:MAG TPA: hypothetical protein VF316_15680, partial [Polyangiaceae bacterium]